MPNLAQVAEHEAGHAVMRWLRGMPATDLTVNETGGYCGGSGKPVRPEDALLVALAGFAVESRYGVGKVDFARSSCDDFDAARKILGATESLRITFSTDGVIAVEGVEDALSRHFERACEMLWPHAEQVDRLGELLSAEGRLTARRVAAMLREYRKNTNPL